MKVQLKVDRLVLDGFVLDARGRAQLQASFESELSRLLSEGGLDASLLSGAVLASLSVAPLTATAGDAPGQVGTALAQSIYGGVGR